MPTTSILNEVSSEQRIVHIWDINQAAIQTDDEQPPAGKHYQSSQNAELSTRRSSQAVTNVFFWRNNQCIRFEQNQNAKRARVV